MSTILGYWKIRGLAQPIRLLLNYVGEEFEDKMFECGPAPDFSRDCWFKVKNGLGLDFPNLPYYIDGNIKLTQSNAIMRYIARKHDMCGSTAEEMIAVDMIADESMDFRNGLVRLSYSSNFDSLKDQYLKDLVAKLDKFEHFLTDKNWFAGEKITFVDFIMYELLDQHKELDPSCLQNSPNLTAFLQHFEDLPAIKKYMSSDRFMKSPLNNKMAAFGNK